MVRPVTGEIPYESTVTAPTQWVPYVYSDRELRAVARRRGLATASVVLGLLGLVGGVFGVWGGPLSLLAVVFAVVACVRQRWARTRWVLGLVSGIVGLVIATGWLFLSAVFDRGL